MSLSPRGQRACCWLRPCFAEALYQEYMERGGTEKDRKGQRYQDRTNEDFLLDPTPLKSRHLVTTTLRTRLPTHNYFHTNSKPDTASSLFLSPALHSAHTQGTTSPCQSLPGGTAQVCFPFSILPQNIFVIKALNPVSNTKHRLPTELDEQRVYLVPLGT